jgi:glycosyltransferase involved in cell wall biosynthesis
LSDDLKVTVISPYPPHRRLARQLHEAQILERLLTALPRSGVGLPRELVSSRLCWSTLHRAARHTGLRSADLLRRQVIRDFDRWASSQLGQPRMVIGRAGDATDTLSEASARNATVISHQGSWHILELQRLMDDEAARIGVPPARYHPFTIERELREYQLADRIMVSSDVARQSFIRQGIDESRVFSVPPGVDISMFSPPTHPRCSGGIISVATVGLRKGQYHLIKAFQKLQARDVSLTLVGTILPGWDKQLHLDQPGVRATGHVSRGRVIEELRRASIFVLPSVADGFGLVLAQAMACGLPVIATETTGIRELITDGVEGLVVSAPPDAESLAAAIDTLLSDSERAQAMGAAARRKVESFGGWDRYGHQLVAACRDVWSTCVKQTR